MSPTPLVIDCCVRAPVGPDVDTRPVQLPKVIGPVELAAIRPPLLPVAVPLIRRVTARKFDGVWGPEDTFPVLTPVFVVALPRHPVGPSECALPVGNTLVPRTHEHGAVGPEEAAMTVTNVPLHPPAVGPAIRPEETALAAEVRTSVRRDLVIDLQGAKETY
jgi:hypothetical protein